MLLANFFTHFVIVIGILPLLYYLYFKNKLSKETSYILPFVIVVFISSVFELIGTGILKIPYYYWFFSYKILAFLGILFFYYKLIKKQVTLTLPIYGIVFCILIGITAYQWNQDYFLVFNSYFNALITIIVLHYSILWFKNEFLNLELTSLASSPIFFFICGLILYYTGTVFLFLMSNFILKHDKILFQEFWMLNVFLNLVFRILLITGIWKGQTK